MSTAEARKAANKRFRERHRRERCEAAKARYAADPERFIAYHRERYRENNEAMKARSKQRYERVKATAEFKEKRASAHLRRKFGITLDEKRAMLVRQNLECAICQEKLPLQLARVDHCHATGRIRGLLCERCNHGVGHFRDNPGFMRAGAAYVELHR